MPEIGSEAIDDLGSPSGLLLAGEDNFARLPVGLDDDGVGREDGADAGAAEVGLYFLKRGGVALGQGSGGGRDREDRLGAGTTSREAGVAWPFGRRAGYLLLNAHGRGDWVAPSGLENVGRW